MSAMVGCPRVLVTDNGADYGEINHISIISIRKLMGLTSLRRAMKDW